MNPQAITPEILLRAYAAGIFPMAESRDDPEIHWVDPRRRGIIPLDGFRISRSLRRRILRCGWRVTADTAFAATVEACADRDETWINDTIFALYIALHRTGHAHSIELWEGSDLIGGVPLGLQAGPVPEASARPLLRAKGHGFPSGVNGNPYSTFPRSQNSSPQPIHFPFGAPEWTGRVPRF